VNGRQSNRAYFCVRRLAVGALLAGLALQPAQPPVARALAPRNEEAVEAPSTETEPNNTRAQASPIGVGALNYANASLGTTTDSDWFWFEALVGVQYGVEVYNASNSINTAVNILVQDSGGAKLAEWNYFGQSNGDGNVTSWARFVAAAAGTVYVQVSPYGGNAGTGTYRVRVLPQFDQPQANWDAMHEPNNMAQHAAPIQVGAANALTSSIESRVSAYLTRAADIDWFRFEAVAGKRYVIEVFNVAQAINRTLDVFVYDSASNQVAAHSYYGNANGSGNINTQVSFLANTSGVHFFYLGPYNRQAATGSGEYSVRVLPQYDEPQAGWDAAHEPNDSAIHSRKIEIGRTNALAAAIEPRVSSFQTVTADHDWYRFDAVQGRKYSIELFNVSKNIRADGYDMMLDVYDALGSQAAVASNANGYANGGGNENSTVLVDATQKGGTYFILVRPAYPDSAQSGSYSIRVLPEYDQPAASWDIAMEPNNYLINAYPLGSSGCPRQSAIVERNPSYMTQNGDSDIYVMTVQRGKQYTFSAYDYGAQFGNYGLELVMYDREGGKIGEQTWQKPTVFTFTANYDGVYYALVYPQNAATSGLYKVRAYETLSPSCNGTIAAQLAGVEGNASVGPIGDNGEVGIGSRGGETINVSAQAPCPVTAQNVTLTIGTATVPMIAQAPPAFRASITLPAGRGSTPMILRYICNGQTVSLRLGEVTLIDPSGRVTDKTTGKPISGARVELRKLPNAFPDSPTQTRDCRTINTRGTGGWAALPAATNNASQAINPFEDALLRGIQQISPAVNPQLTGADGRYAWDVVEGCWYIVISARGYKTMVSPYVGVPPAVTDLDIQMEPGPSNLVFLPYTRRGQR
jgi:hypothetical protein